MFYEFPRIVHIQQALDAIKGDEDLFYVVEKDGYTVINYKLPCNKTFPAVTDRNTAIRRELRGIKFDSVTGETVARPYHKFWNAGEREETLLPNIPILKALHKRLEKLDGSMVHPIKVGGGTRWCTKMGVTDVSMQAETWIAGRNDIGLNNFVRECLHLNLTPIFEWCSRRNRIVVDHPEDKLILTAVRDTFSGEYHDYDELLDHQLFYGVDIVSVTTPYGVDIIDEYVESVHKYNPSDLTEGEVLRFNTGKMNGHMVKVKTEAYVNLHRTKDKIQRERNFVAILLNQQLDDLKPFMLLEDIEKAEKYEMQLNQNLKKITAQIFGEVSDILKCDMPRKDFALTSKLDPFFKSIIFHLWDKQFPIADIEEEVFNRLKDACEHEQKFERLRPILLRKCEW